MEEFQKNAVELLAAVERGEQFVMILLPLRQADGALNRVRQWRCANSRALGTGWFAV